MRKFITLALLFFIAVASASANTLTSYAKYPAHWKSEVIKFPFDFAPDIPLKGAEELLFAPGMYKADQEDFFSYAFSWVVTTDTNAALNTEDMTKYLKQYYVGLYKAVAKKEQAFVELSLNEITSAHWQYQGQINWTEPFITKEAQTLHFLAKSINCKTSTNKNVYRWYFIVSPQQSNHPIWTSLNNITESPCA